MLIPQFWAESAVQHKSSGRQITIRRFGWSDESQEDAGFMAETRANEALRRAIAGQVVKRRERKHAYNGAPGMPIREEIVQRHGGAVITRNSYGVLCLNVPDVFFTDIDFPVGPAWQLWAATIVVPVSLVGWIALRLNSTLALIFGIMFTFFTWTLLAHGLHRMVVGVAGGQETLALRPIRRFIKLHPEWLFRVYRTPAGLRLLAMHSLVDPADPRVSRWFRELKSDPVYARMCLNQQCFRARLSPKPWRIGLHTHLRPGIWPISSEKLEIRRRWIERYESLEKDFASCRFFCAIGTGLVHAKAREIQQLHDAMCRSDSSLPLA